MALINLIANSGDSVKGISDSIQRGREESRKQGAYETNQTLQNLKIDAVNKANEKEEAGDVIRQELAGTRGREKRRVLMQRAIDLGYGKMVSDNQSAVKSMDSTQLQVRGNQNDQIKSQMTAIEQMKDPVQQEAAYQSLVKSARSFDYEGDLSPTYLESKRTGMWEKEKVLTRVSKDQFNREYKTRQLQQQVRNQNRVASQKDRRLGQRDRSLDLQEKRDANALKVAKVNAFAKMAKAASKKSSDSAKAKSKAIKFTGSEFSQYNSSIHAAFSGLDVAVDGTGKDDDGKIQYSDATRDYGIDFRNLSKKHDATTAATIAKARAINRLKQNLAWDDDGTKYGADPGKDAKGRQLYSIPFIQRYKRGEVIELNGRKGVYFTNWLNLDKSGKPKIQFFPMSAAQLEAFGEDY